MSQSDDQRSQAIAKVSELGEQIDLGGDDLSNAFDELRKGNLEAQQLAMLGQTLGQQIGALLGRRAGEAIGWKFANESGTLSFSSIVSTLRDGGPAEGEDEESGEDKGEGTTDERTDGSDEEGNAGNNPGEEGNERIEGDGSGSFEDMSDDELRNLANDLMNELDRRESSES